MLEDYRKQIVEMGRYIYESGLTSKYSGNISVRDDDSGLIAIKPSGVPWLDISVGDVVVIDVNGKVIEGHRKPSIETPMHTSVYKFIKEAKAVVHTHSRYGTGFAVARESIPPIAVNSVELGGTIPVSPFYLPGTIENAEAIAEGFKTSKAILLAAHGVLCFGEDLEEAVYYNEIVEEIAHWRLIQKVLGSNSTISPEEIAMIDAI